MDTKFEIIKYGMPGFSNQLNSFISISQTSPVYSSQFSDYYSELCIESEQNKSILVNLSGETILGLLFSSHTNSKNKNYGMTYFGLPAALLVSEAASVEEINEATQILLQALNDSGILVANGRISIPHTFQVKTTALKSNKIERVFFSNANVELRFDRIINLTRASELIKSEYSNSARAALKSQFMDIKVTSRKNSPESIEQELASLKKLHLLSAGRLTRSEKSWDLQLEMIKNGSSLIVSGTLEDKVMTSALFMLNSGSAFYGVSASATSPNRVGLSHHLIDFAIQEFRNFGIHEIWLGAQHTSSTSEMTNKEKRIEEFKGFFGGSIHTTLIARVEL